jgi:Ca2+-transporting ATPase
LLEAAALACEPKAQDSMERTIVAHCAEHGVDVDGLHAQWKLVHDYDFDPIGKHMSHVWKRADGGAGRIVAKGALEGILEHCALDAAAREQAHRANEELAGQGMRVLAVAGRTTDGGGFSGVRDQDESRLRLYGLLGFQDPVRPDVPAAVAECQRAGLHLKLITGDHALTAHAIADATGLAHESDGIITGPQLERLDAAGFAAMVRNKTIFARVLPEQKFAIVDALMNAGEIVAMTGDGINDAPALRHAHIGVSMGRRGTEVARAAADIVLLDDDFASLVATIREGRRLFGNLEQAFRYLIGFKLMLVAMALGAPVLGLPILLTPIDVVWLELIVHPVSALAFEGREPARDVMSRPPLDPTRPILPGRTGAISAICGALLAAAAIGIFVAMLGGGEESARSAAIVIAVLGSLLLVWAELAGAEPWWKVALPRDLRFWTIIAAVAASLPILIGVPAAARVLGLAPIGATTWLYAGLLALAAVGWRAPGWHRGRA